MSTNEFDRITWQEDSLLTEDLLNQMSANDAALNNNKIQGKLTWTSSTKGIQIVSGKIIIPKNLSTDRAAKAISFGGVFTVPPVIVATATGPSALSIVVTASNITSAGASLTAVSMLPRSKPEFRGAVIHWMAMGV